MPRGASAAFAMQRLRRAFLVAVCGGLATCNEVLAASLGQRIHPELDPKSDKKLFGPPASHADYAQDGRLDGHHGFEYPFPRVQAGSKFDDDFVSDQNQDNGEWSAQNDYDLARSKLFKEKREADAAKKKEKDQSGEVQQAKRQYEEAQLSEERLEELTKKVETKMRNVDDCKQQLEDARNELKNFMDQRKDAGIVATKGNVDKQLRKKRDVLKSYDAEQQDVVEAEKALKRAEARLRALRRGASDKDSSSGGGKDSDGADDDNKKDDDKKDKDDDDDKKESKSPLDAFRSNAAASGMAVVVMALVATAEYSLW